MAPSSQGRGWGGVTGDTSQPQLCTFYVLDQVPAGHKGQKTKNPLAGLALGLGFRGKGRILPLPQKPLGNFSSCRFLEVSERHQSPHREGLEPVIFPPTGGRWRLSAWTGTGPV